MGIFKTVFKKNSTKNINTIDMKNTLSNMQDVDTITSKLLLEVKYKELMPVYDHVSRLSGNELKDYYKEKFVDHNIPVSNAYTFDIIFNPYSEKECQNLGEPYLSLYKMKDLVHQSLSCITFYNFAYLYLKENNRLNYECTGFPIELAAINGMLAPHLAMISLSKDASLRKVEGFNEMRDYWGFDKVYDWANNTRIGDKETGDKVLFDELNNKQYDIINTEYNAHDQGTYFATVDYIGDTNKRLGEKVIKKCKDAEISFGLGE